MRARAGPLLVHGRRAWPPVPPASARTLPALPPVLGMDDPWRYRIRGEFEAIRSTDGWRFGFHRLRSRSVIGNFGAIIQVAFGGRIGNFISLCEKARQEAFELMLEHAEQTGGNAVVGIRYDANEIMKGVTEVLCYGTAVVAEEDAESA